MTISYFNITSLFSNNFPEISSFKLLCEIGKENMTLLIFANGETNKQKGSESVFLGSSRSLNTEQRPV